MAEYDEAGSPAQGGGQQTNGIRTCDERMTAKAATMGRLPVGGCALRSSGGLEVRGGTFRMAGDLPKRISVWGNRFAAIGTGSSST